MTVVWREAARADIARIVRYISTDNPVAARQVAREIFLAGESLLTFPHRGRRGRILNTRELVIVAPYIVVYRVTKDDNVAILRIWHGAQKRGE